jgi:hypothetical protein
VLALIVAVALGGCGGSGSSSSAERSKLAKEISSQLQAGNAPSDLTGCVSQQSLGLPTAQLRALANAGSNSPPATQQLAARLIVTCMKKGDGIELIHSLIAKGILSSSAGKLPAVFTNCIVAKANATTPAQLDALISAYATQNQSVAQSRARQVGETLATQCLTVPRVINTLKPMFLAPIRRELRKTSAAFRNCVLAKAERLSAAQLEGFGLKPSAGEAFGERAAKACIAAGDEP